MLLWLLGLLTLLRPAIAQDEIQAFEKAVSIMASRHPGELSEAELYRAAIRGLVERLDDLSPGGHSALLTEREFAVLQAEQRGEFAGIGVQFHALTAQGLMVTRVYPDSPASRAALRPGDLVVAVNDVPFVGLQRSDMIAVLLSAGAPSVVLDVRRANAPPRQVSVPWGTYPLAPTQACPDWVTVPCLELAHFGLGASAAVEAALRALPPDKPLVIDLRGNSGGLFSELLATADLFLEPGEVVVIRDVPGKDKAPSPARRPAVWRGRLALVVDESTTGLAEAFAAALREHQRATLVGTRTAGASVDESFEALGAGLVLRLTDVQLRSPAGRSWAIQGLAPDLLVENPDPVLPVDATGWLPDLQMEAAVRAFQRR